MVKLEDYSSDPLFKALVNSGFSEEDISTMVENGSVTFAKSKSEKDMDRSEEYEKRNIENDEKHIDNLKRDEKEDKKDEKDLKRDKEAHKEKEEKDKMEKSFTMDDLRAFGASLVSNIVKGFSEVMDSRLGNIEKSLETFGQQPPSFKGVQTTAMLEKSMKIEKDDAGKTMISVTSQRPLAQTAISKALESASSDILKSIEDDAMAFLANPEAETIGENLARYMFKEHNIKFQK